MFLTNGTKISAWKQQRGLRMLSHLVSAYDWLIGSYLFRSSIPLNFDFLMKLSNLRNHDQIGVSEKLSLPLPEGWVEEKYFFKIHIDAEIFHLSAGDGAKR